MKSESRYGVEKWMELEDWDGRRSSSWTTKMQRRSEVERVNGGEEQRSELVAKITSHGKSPSKSNVENVTMNRTFSSQPVNNVSFA